MPSPSPAFEETHHRYLKLLGTVDLPTRADHLGAEMVRGAMHFADRPAALVQACRQLWTRPFEDGLAYEVSLTFNFLPRIPRLLRFNEGDHELPAQCAVLFPQSAASFLDMECMAIGGTLLAATRPQSLQGPH